MSNPRKPGPAAIAAEAEQIRAQLAAIGVSGGGGTSIWGGIGGTLANQTDLQAALNGKAGTAVATTATAGLMSAADKTKLDGITAGANIVGTGVTAIVALTQAAYDAMSPKVATTLYVITD